MKRGETFEELAVEHVEVGHVIAIKSGARVPLDLLPDDKIAHVILNALRLLRAR